MVRSVQERVLLIGDTDRRLAGVVEQAAPGAVVRSVATVFDGIAELASERYSTVLAATEPIERRPDAAVRALRDVAGDGRLLLFGHPTLEPLNQRMLQYGCDDYLVTPATVAEVQRAFGAPPMRLKPQAASREHPAPALPAQQTKHPAAGESPPGHETPAPQEGHGLPPAEVVEPAPAEPTADGSDIASVFSTLPVAEIVLDALLRHPGDATAAAVRDLGGRVGPGARLAYTPASAAVPEPGDGEAVVSGAVDGPAGRAGAVHLFAPAAQKSAGEAFVARVAALLSKTAGLQERHNRLQKLAFTDDLTGLFNGRYFKHFLTRTLADARRLRFPVTLFLFDIDNFKSYNDRFGHGAGDEILRQTGELMRRCVRDHDLVARISGDEFAVVFWEKAGPRVPREPGVGVPGRPPSEPQEILGRFRRLLETQDFPLLGPTARGTLTISGGLAVFPYDAQDVPGLIDAADKALMFGAKRSGRNSIALVGGADRPE